MPAATYPFLLRDNVMGPVDPWNGFDDVKTDGIRIVRAEWRSVGWVAFTFRRLSAGAWMEG